jgi:hypothetical protein
MDVTATPVQTDAGPRTNLVFNLLAHAWRAEYVVQKGLKSSNRNIHLARVAGIEADREKLLAIGIAGMVADEPGGKIVTWDSLLASEQKRAAANP